MPTRIDGRPTGVRAASLRLAGKGAWESFALRRDWEILALRRKGAGPGGSDTPAAAACLRGAFRGAVFREADLLPAGGFLAAVFLAAVLPAAFVLPAFRVAGFFATCLAGRDFPLATFLLAAFLPTFLLLAVFLPAAFFTAALLFAAFLTAAFLLTDFLVAACLLAIFLTDFDLLAARLAGAAFLTVLRAAFLSALPAAGFPPPFPDPLRAAAITCLPPKEYSTTVSEIRHRSGQKSSVFDCVRHTAPVGPG
jgi:hypothetical protein